MDIVKEYNILEGKYIAFEKIFNNYKQLLRRLGFSEREIEWKLENLMLFKEHGFTLDKIGFILKETEKELESLVDEKSYSKERYRDIINQFDEVEINEGIRELECDIAELEFYQSGYLINDYEDTLYGLYEYFSTNYHRLLKETMGIGFYNLFKDNLKSETNYHNWSELLKTLKETMNLYLERVLEREKMEELVGLLDYQNLVLKK